MVNRFEVFGEPMDAQKSAERIFNPNFFGTYSDQKWTVVSRTKDVLDPFYKTTMCKYQDSCKRKKTCKYAHNLSEKRPFFHPSDLKPIDFTWRTKMCQNGDLCHKKDCGFAHNLSELRKVPCKYQSFCKKIGVCERSHYFLEPHMMVQTSDMKNNSLAVRGKSIFQDIEKNLTLSALNLEKMENNMENMLQKIDSQIQNKEDQLSEFQKIKDEYDIMIKELKDEVRLTDDLIDSLESKGKTKKRNFIWDSDDEEDHNIKKMKSWASDSESDTEIDKSPMGKNKLSWCDIIKKNIA